MAVRALKRYGLEGIAKILIAIGLLFDLLAWIVAAYYFGFTSGKITLFIIPFIFTCISIVLLLVIRYRYALFEDYPYLMNLPSIFYHIKERKGSDNRSAAFSMIFTVHTLGIAALGLMGLLLTFSIADSISAKAVSPFFYSYLIVVAILIIAVFVQYRRIYIRFSK